MVDDRFHRHPPAPDGRHSRWLRLAAADDRQVPRQRTRTLGSITHPCPVDKRCLERLGVSFSTFTEIVAASATDGEVLVRLRRHGVASPGEQWFDAVAYEEELQRAA